MSMSSSLLKTMLALAALVALLGLGRLWRR